MGQGQTNNPEHNPYSLPDKILGFAQPGSYYTHTTEKTFLIGLFAKLESFIGQDIVINISTNMHFLSIRFLQQTILTHTYLVSISHFMT